MFAKLRGARARVSAVVLALVVLGGVACSAVSSRIQPAAPPSATSAVTSRAAVPPQSGAAVAPGAQVGASAAAPGVAAPAAAPASGPAGAPAGAIPDTSAQILDRMVIRTSQLTVEVSEIEQALAQARAIAARGGGFVSASNTHFERVNDQDRMVADLTLQVRSESADAAISDLRALGKVTAEASGSQDVTDEYVDLDSNLRNLQATEAAILKLMDKATQIQDVLALQRELTNVRGQIERIQGRKTYLERRSDMATISLSLRLPPPTSSQTGAGGAWDPLQVAQRGWQASLNLLRGVAEAVIVVVAFSWWLVPFVALGAYVWYHRRRTGSVPATATEAA